MSFQNKLNIGRTTLPYRNDKSMQESINWFSTGYLSESFWTEVVYLCYHLK
jgi:hypothetical protein